MGLYVYQPCCKDFLHRSASFGPKLPFSPGSGLKLDLVYVSSLACSEDDGGNDGENVIENDDGLTKLGYRKLNVGDNYFDPDLIKDAAVLVSRGECSFVSKVYNLQQLGAKAVIVFDNNPKSHELITMGDNEDGEYLIEIPSIFVSHSTGMKLINELSPIKVDLFRADEEWITPMVDVPLPLLAIFFLLMIAVILASASSLLRACHRFRNPTSNGQQYAVNNRGLLEPLGANVVIIDGSSKERSESENEDQVYYVPATLEQITTTSSMESSSDVAVATEVSSSSNENSEIINVDPNHETQEQQQ